MSWNRMRYLQRTRPLAVLLAVALMAWIEGSGSLLVPAFADGVDKLLQIESKVRAAVEANTPATVSITDGVGYGSGVVVDPDGLVLTAGHVLASGGENFKVIFPNGREVRAKALGKNLNVDAGMIQLLEPGPFPYVELGEPRRLSRGSWCICLGHSGGYELGRRPPVRAGRVVDFETDTLVTDCVLIGGDSGGPLFDLQGRLIGIHSNIGSSIADNRHISINTFLRYWDRLKRGDSWGSLPDLEIQEQRRPALGVRVDLESDKARIKTVHEGSAAEEAGLQANDFVIEFDGIKVKGPQHLIDLVKQERAGRKIELLILRDGQQLKKSIRLKWMGS